MTDDAMISRARQPKRESWLDRRDEEFYEGHITLKVLAGHSTSELKREIFSGEVIHIQKIFEALELITKRDRTKNRRLRIYPQEYFHLKRKNTPRGNGKK